jgi:uncharacterized protein YjbJ (UPF0337 family)
MATAATSTVYDEPDGPEETVKEKSMGSKDIAAGKVKQIKGKINEVAGAVKGDTGQEIRGKIQKAVGKVQENIGRATRDADDTRGTRK